MSIGAYCAELLTLPDDYDECDVDEVHFDVDEYGEMYWDENEDENDSDDSVSSSEEPDPESDQSGGRLQYHIELVRERTIAKFKVKGSDYKESKPLTEMYHLTKWYRAYMMSLKEGIS